LVDPEHHDPTSHTVQAPPASPYAPAVQMQSS
jgi:hypothetical protein